MELTLDDFEAEVSQYFEDLPQEVVAGTMWCLWSKNTPPMVHRI